MFWLSYKSFSSLSDVFCQKMCQLFYETAVRREWKNKETGISMSFFIVCLRYIYKQDVVVIEIP